MSIAISLHLLFSTVWIGGMFFAYMALRPVAASQLEPPLRLRLWVGVFGKFFPWVWASLIVLIASGLWMTKMMGGMSAVNWHVHAMITLGVIMVLIFLHVFFAPYKRLKRFVAAEDWPQAGKQLAQIRVLVGINTAVGLCLVVVASGGRFF